jgi:hypothetical protein
MAYDKMLETKSQYLVRPWTDAKPFKAASRDQLAAWSDWIASHEATQAIEAVSAVESEAKRLHSTTKYSPVEVMRQLDSMSSTEMEKFKSGLYMVGFNVYKSEQLMLLHVYTTSAETHENSEHAYNALCAHMKTHGDIILGVPTKHHHKSNEAVNGLPGKPGRRATRRAANEADANDTERIYTPAELRRLARGLPADEEVVVE